MNHHTPSPNSSLIADAEALEHAARLADDLILSSEEDRRAVAQYADHCRKSAARLRARIVYDHASTDAEARRDFSGCSLVFTIGVLIWALNTCNRTTQ